MRCSCSTGLLLDAHDTNRSMARAGDEFYDWVRASVIAPHKDSRRIRTRTLAAAGAALNCALLTSAVIPTTAQHLSSPISADKALG